MVSRESWCEIAQAVSGFAIVLGLILIMWSVTTFGVIDEYGFRFDVIGSTVIVALAFILMGILGVSLSQCQLSQS